MTPPNVCALGALMACAVALPAQAFVIECRIVERVGDADIPLPGQTITVAPGSTHRYRIQFRVIPNADDARGGFLGWLEGLLDTTGGINTRRINPCGSAGPLGRLAPFNFATQTSAEGTPRVDPFTTLSEIHATLGTLAPAWTCIGGNPGPQPSVHPLGIGTFVSVYEFDSQAEQMSYSVTVSGLALAAVEWRTTGGIPDLPECNDPADPFDDVPGSQVYAPFPTPPVGIAYTLEIRVCAAEWNHSGALDSEDFFDFLDDFLAGEADFNHDSRTNSQDLFDYLTAFFGGCS